MSSDVAISVRGLSKSYTIRHNQARHTTLGEALVHRMKQPFERAEREEFWALDDVSFDVKQGELLGVIGRNGAGKSTLLKILSRITAPTKGEVHVYGRVGSLLEVGTGFHPELTGRENIYLNGSILGMRRREIDRRFDAIVDFAGVHQFLDTPVKRYSSGMYVRLAFAVAAHLDSEILLVDEVLAVGDVEFQERCIGKIRDVARSGRTVLYVTHNLSSISQFCDTVVWMDRGGISFEGEVQEGIDAFLAALRGAGSQVRRGHSGLICDVALEDGRVRPGDPMTMGVHFSEPLAAPDTFISAHWYDEGGTEVLYLDSRYIGRVPCGASSATFSVRSPWLRPGCYFISVFVGTAGSLADAAEHAAVLEVMPGTPYETGHADNAMAPVFADFRMSFAIAQP